MGKKKKEKNEAKQTLLFSEEELKAAEAASAPEDGQVPPKSKRSRSMIPFFLRSTREKKKAQEDYIKNKFSDEVYKPYYSDRGHDTGQDTGGIREPSDNTEEKLQQEGTADPATVEARAVPEDAAAGGPSAESVIPKTPKKRGRPKSVNKPKIENPVNTRKIERLRKTKKRLMLEYTEKYSEGIPEDIGMDLREKKEFRKEIDDINAKIQMIENDDGEIECIPTELKNTYTVFRDAAVKHKLLTADEEKELSKRVQEGDEKAFNTFVEANYRLVIACAKQIYSSRGKSSILDYMDIIQEGIIGLLIAVSKFDWRHDTRFSTYGVPWIYQRINRVADSQRNGLTIPGYAGYCVRRMNEDIKKYQAGTLDETNMKQSELRRMKELAMISTPMIAIDPSSDPDDSQGTVSPEMLAADSVRDDSAILEKIEEEQYQDRFHNVLRDILDSEEYDMVCQRHGMGEYEGDGTASLRTLAEARDKSIEYTRLQIEDIEKKIRRSTRLRRLNKEWFSLPPAE